MAQQLERWLRALAVLPEDSISTQVAKNQLFVSAVPGGLTLSLTSPDNACTVVHSLTCRHSIHRV